MVCGLSIFGSRTKLRVVLRVCLSEFASQHLIKSRLQFKLLIEEVARVVNKLVHLSVKH